MELETCLMSTMKIPHLYTDEAGDSRFGTVEIPLEAQNYAPPAAPFLTSQPQQSTQYFFFRVELGWAGTQHTTPDRHLVTCVTGALRFIGSAGDEYVLKAGQTMLDENTTGKGHATEVVSPEAVEGLIVRLD
jgi:hypothetical protein